MDKIEKASLGMKEIKKDLQRYFLKQLSELACTLLLVIFGFYLFKMIFSLIFNTNEKIVSILLILYGLFFSLLFIYNFLNIITSLYLISINKFKISVDWVTDKLSKRWLPIGVMNVFFFRPYTLCFAKNGKYSIPSCVNYEWSDLVSMQDDKVYERTSLNDEFYLVSIKRKIIVAYNKKWFELYEN